VGLDLKFEAWPSTEGGGRVGSGVAWNKKKKEEEASLLNCYFLFASQHSVYKIERVKESSFNASFCFLLCLRIPKSEILLLKRYLPSSFLFGLTFCLVAEKAEEFRVFEMHSCCC
jgi:hypothetical protein